MLLVCYKFLIIHFKDNLIFFVNHHFNSTFYLRVFASFIDLSPKYNICLKFHMNQLIILIFSIITKIKTMYVKQLQSI